MKTSKNRRQHFFSLLSSKREQFRFAIQVLSVCIVFMCAFSAVFVIMLQSFNEFIAQFQSENASLSEMSSILLWDTLPTLIALLSAFFLSMLLLLLERTQRVFAPVDSMKDFLGEIEKGNFAARLRIRKGDDFQNIAGKLNIMAEVLEKRYKGQTLQESQNCQASQDSLASLSDGSSPT